MTPGSEDESHESERDVRRSPAQRYPSSLYFLELVLFVTLSSKCGVLPGDDCRHLRDGYGSFGLDPREKYLVRCRVEPSCNAVEGAIQRSSRFRGNWTVWEIKDCVRKRSIFTP